MIDGTRHDARERAVNLLYESEMKDVTIGEVTEELEIPLESYAEILVSEVRDNIEVIDDRIEAASTDWDIDRMPAIDRNILRVATAELLTQVDVPVAVIIDEAIELAKEFSTDDSGRFINGILSAIAKTAR